MAKIKKSKISISRTNTECGIIYTLQGSHKLNRGLTVYYARKNEASIFFIIKESDTVKLLNVGYTISSIFVPAKKYPIALNYGNYTKLEVAGY